MWGFSPAVDLLDACPVRPRDCPRRVLLGCPSDIRHVLVSMARRHRSCDGAPVEFTVVERQLEVLARHLLLMQIAFDWELPVRHRANVLLEVFGNVHVQSRTQRYIERLARQLETLICDGRGVLAGVVDLSRLKYRERDSLVNIFHSWRSTSTFDVDGLRDHRLRALFGQRYDSRKNVVDWDYQSRIRPKAGVIHSKLYRDWRLNGHAFEFGDQHYVEPNRTLGSYAEGVMKKGKDKGLKKEVLGFWADIVNSPYPAFGVTAEPVTPMVESLFQVQNKGTGVEQYRHNTVEVAVFNVMSWLWEIETGEVYTMTKEHDIFSGLGGEITEAGSAAGADGSSASQATAEALRRARSIVRSLTGFRIQFMCGSIEDLCAKSSPQQNHFDAVFLSTLSAQALSNSNLLSILHRDAVVVAESAAHLVPLSKEQEVEYDARLDELAKGAGMAAVPAPFAVCASPIGDGAGPYQPLKVFQVDGGATKPTS
eukprot:CAMPEP_0118981558 /NCGR_PEP_ID=MMETSP1173-20130426/30806_1 /TAXON_ID=1034831 /ORGANISM="Rhizochromulina marina cf, Strain CCMP1243" /LENGTH=481 /DNA_ID=CAMNT_0006931987 /DNA_START=24 /DNA_END=1469 /DNA_ORIENTATION=-